MEAKLTAAEAQLSNVATGSSESSVELETALARVDALDASIARARTAARETSRRMTKNNALLRSRIESDKIRGGSDAAAAAAAADAAADTDMTVKFEIMAGTVCTTSERAHAWNERS